MTTDFQLSRVRTKSDGTEIHFIEAIFAGRFPIRAEVAFGSIEELREFRVAHPVLAVRMQELNAAKGKRPQVNLVGVRHIDGL